MTINKMILNTLKTKVGNEPKYKEALEALGLVIRDDDNSLQGYYEVHNPKTGRTLVISRDRADKVGLFSPYIKIAGYTALNSVDLYNYLVTDRRKEEEPKTKVQQYLEIKADIEREERSRKYYEDIIEAKRADLARLEGYQKDAIKRQLELKGELYKLIH